MNRLILLLLIGLPIFLPAQVQQRNAEGKWGTKSPDGTTAIPFIYEELADNNRDGIYIARKDGKVGLIDKVGKTLVPFDYTHIKEYLQPFGWQSGFYVVIKEETGVFGDIDAWGVINEKNEVIIPLKYRYVRCLDSNLIVTRLRTDTLLNFFSGKGELLYQIPGRKLYKGFDNQSMNVETVNRKQRMAYRTGEWVLPEEFGFCKWTDGETYIIIRDMKSGAIDRQGNIKIPFEYNTLKHIEGDDFFFGPESHHHLGVYNLKKGVTIPVKYYVEHFGDFYFHHDEKGEKMGVLDKNGKEVFPLENRKSSLYYLHKWPAHDPMNYGTIENLTTGLNALINRQGKVILPQQFTDIKYASDVHPLLTRTDLESKTRYEIYTINGEKIPMTQSFEFLDFTRNPRMLIAAQNRSGPYGLLYLDHPEKTEFKYKRISVFANDFLLVQSAQGYQLFSADGKPLNETIYRNISVPDKKHLRAFSAIQGSSGTLIAVARLKGQPYSALVGLNNLGEVFEVTE